jgi:hypothetical protein
MNANGACVYALDKTKPDTILATGTANVSAACGVYDDSNNATNALEVKGGGNHHSGDYPRGRGV